MSERIGIQIPVWCSAICRNAFNEKCVEECSINRDCSYFEEKPNLKLSDMPRFPLQHSVDMTRDEKFTVVAIYLSKVVDHLQGNEAESKIYPPVRANIYDSRNSVLSNTVKIQTLLTSEQITTPEKEDE